MSDTQGSCLTAKGILEYLDGDMAEGRRAEVERHLDECRLCQAAVEGVAGLEWREGFLRSTERILSRVRAPKPTPAVAAVTRRAAPRFRFAPQYLTLVATLVLGVGAAIYLARPVPGEALFLRHFEPYPSTQPRVRGGPKDGGSNALALYEARDYRGALAAFDESLGREPNDPVVLFYAGLSRLALGQVREASLDLEKVLKLGDQELQAPAEWYLALAHLRDSDQGDGYLALAISREPVPAEARPRLERIAATGGFYQEKARALLSELDTLEKRN